MATVLKPGFNSQEEKYAFLLTAISRSFYRSSSPIEVTGVPFLGVKLGNEALCFRLLPKFRIRKATVYFSIWLRSAVRDVYGHFDRHCRVRCQQLRVTGVCIFHHLCCIYVVCTADLHAEDSDGSLAGRTVKRNGKTPMLPGALQL
jgi:hypothetical protein